MGAAKRLLSGEIKPIGPHPSTIRVAAAYTTQANIEKRFQIVSTDAQERSLAEAREDNARLQGVAWLDSTRRALQLPVRTFTTACVYYHRFRLAHPNMEYNWADAAAASLLTSCKNEDTLKKSRDILAAAYNLKQPLGHEHVGADDPIFEGPSKIVIGLERLVLESGGFDFRTRSPHLTLIKISKSLPPTESIETVAQLGWTVLTDLHRTFAPLKQTASTLACASLELAAHLIATTAENGVLDAADMLQALDYGRWATSREEVMETLLDGLDLYTHHTSATILGTKYSLDDLLRIRLSLNKESREKDIPRHTAAQPPPSPDNPQSNGNTLRVSNGHPTPVSPPQPGSLPSHPAAAANHFFAAPEGGETLRFMLDPQRAANERADVVKFTVEEWEEYEEEVEVPAHHADPRDRSRGGRHRDHDTADRGDRDRDRDRHRDRDQRSRGHDYDDHDRASRGEREGNGQRYDERRFADRDRRYDHRRDRDRERDGHRDRERERGHRSERDRDRRYR